MERYLLMVQTNAIRDRDPEFNAWYDERHLPDLLAIPGVMSARRYILAESQLGNGLDPMVLTPQQFRYLALYEIDTENETDWIRELKRRIGTGRMSVSDALSPTLSVVMWKAL